MGSIQVRGAKLYAKIKGVDGEWRRVATGHDDTPENRRAVTAWLAKTERRIEAERAAGATAPDGITVRGWAERWIDDRRKLDLDWKHDETRLKYHVLPQIGDLLVANVCTRHIVELFRVVRTKPSKETGEPLSPRTIYNVYGTVSAMFRDAKLADLIEHTPCCLTDRQLGPKRDKDPEWRAGAIFARDEAQTLISTSKIPEDRRMVYGLELLAGLRPGEAAALRWRHYDAAKQPLGELLIALAYSTKRDKAKGTKTETVKHVPVHPTLAAMLAEWKLHGWERMMGREPKADDLIVPLPPADAKSRTSRKASEPYRTYWYSGRRWRDDDLPALGWRNRRHYDMRATFITLALEDGADPHVLESRVTHTKRSRSAFDMYNRGLQWEITCREVAKLRLVRVRDAEDNLIALPIAAAGGGSSRELDGVPSRRGPAVVQSVDSVAISSTSKLRRRVSKGEPISDEDTRSAPSSSSSRDVSARDPDSDLSLSTPGSPALDQAVVQADPVAAALDTARDWWRANRDARQLRRALVRLLADLEGP